MLKNIEKYKLNSKPLPKLFNSDNVGDIRNQLKVNASSTVNPKMIETWISEFITESEKTNVPSTFIRLDKKSPLSRYNLDRETLVGF